jgi:predicted acetyltransferase
MKLLVLPAHRDDAPRLAALFQLYAYDFSEWLDLDVGDDGRFPLPPLEPYWDDVLCHAFLLRVDDALAGFALVQERSRLTGETGVRDMAEFFVLRRYRRRGVGERAAVSLFERFPGAWEVRQKRENVAAIAFWRHTIAHCTGGRFHEETLDDSRWRGVVQRFRVPGPADTP